MENVTIMLIDESSRVSNDSNVWQHRDICIDLLFMRVSFKGTRDQAELFVDLSILFPILCSFAVASSRTKKESDFMVARGITNLDLHQDKYY